MDGSAYIFSCPFNVVQPLEKEVAEALATLPKSSEETSMNPCVLVQPVLGSHFWLEESFVIWGTWQSCPSN